MVPPYLAGAPSQPSLLLCLSLSPDTCLSLYLSPCYESHSRPWCLGAAAGVELEFLNWESTALSTRTSVPYRPSACLPLCPPPHLSVEPAVSLCLLAPPPGSSGTRLAVLASRVTLGDISHPRPTSLSRRYQEYTGSIPGIYREYTRSIPGIYQEYTGSIPGVYQEYTGSIPGIYQEYTGNIPGVYQEYTRSIPGVYQEYTGNIPGIYREYTRNIPGVYQEYTRNIPGVYQEYTGNIPGIYREYTRNIPGVYQEYTRNIPGVYQEYTRSIPWDM